MCRTCSICSQSKSSSSCSTNPSLYNRLHHNNVLPLLFLNRFSIVVGISDRSFRIWIIVICAGRCKDTGRWTATDRKWTLELVLNCRFSETLESATRAVVHVLLLHCKQAAATEKYVIQVRENFCHLETIPGNLEEKTSLLLNVRILTINIARDIQILGLNGKNRAGRSKFFWLSWGFHL